MTTSSCLRRLAVAGVAALFVLAGVRAWPSDDIGRDNVLVLLDASGSMSQQMTRANMRKMEAAKAALKEVLNQVSAKTNIGLLVFSARNLPNDWAYPLGPRNDEMLLKAIDAPQPGDGTPLGRFIKMAADQLLAEREKEFGYGTYRLLIVTDGEAQDGNLVDQYTPEVVARGITVDVIGVDMSQSHTLATKVHSYRSADDPTSLKRAISAVFAEVATTGGDSTEAESFELTEPVPFEVAAGMLKALTVAGNQPIGERARPPSEQEQPQPEQPPQVRPSAATSPAPPGAPAPPSPQAAPKRMFFPWQLWVFFIIVFVFVAFRGRRRR